jgi:hypothetical protein
LPRSSASCTPRTSSERLGSGKTRLLSAAVAGARARSRARSLAGKHHDAALTRPSPSPIPPQPSSPNPPRAATDAVKKPFAKTQKEKTEGKVGKPGEKDAAGKQRRKQKNDPEAVRHVDKTPSALFFRHNSQLGPPYQVLVDTNFINFSIKNKVG